MLSVSKQLNKSIYKMAKPDHFIVLSKPDIDLNTGLDKIYIAIS